MGFGSDLPEQLGQCRVSLRQLAKQVGRGRNDLVGRHAATRSPAHSIGHDRQQRAGVPLAGQDRNPVLLLGPVTQMFGNRRADFELRGRHASMVGWAVGSLSVGFGRPVPLFPLLLAFRYRLRGTYLSFAMDEEQIKRRIVELQTEHRDLDDAIERLQLQPGVDELRLRRLKKRRLMLRDCIARLQMELVPDIPA